MAGQRSFSMRGEAIPAGSACRGISGSADLPPPGASPAGDLQRRVGEAALRSFYEPRRAPRWPRFRNGGLIVACAGLCWCAVFGIGAWLA